MAAMMTAAADDQHWRDKEHGQVDRRWAAEQVAAATGTGERELRREGIASSREQQQEIPLHPHDHRRGHRGDHQHGA